MGQAPSLQQRVLDPVERLRNLIARSTGLNGGGDPGSAPAATTSTTAALTRVDSGLWSGNRLLFGPHFVLRYPLPRGTRAVNGAPVGDLVPGPADLGTAEIVSGQLAAAAAATAALNLHGGVSPAMIANWRAGHHEQTMAAGEFHVVASTVQCIVNVKRGSLEMSPIVVGTDVTGGVMASTTTRGDATILTIPVPNAPTAASNQSLSFVVDAAVPCTVSVYLLVKEDEGKRLVSVAPGAYQVPLASLSLPAGLDQQVHLSQVLPAGINLPALCSQYAHALAANFPSPPPLPTPSSHASPPPTPVSSARAFSSSPTSITAAPLLPISAVHARSNSGNGSNSPVPQGGSSSPTNGGPVLGAAANVPMYPIVITISASSNDAFNGNGAATVATEQWTYVALDPRDLEVRIVKQKLWLGNVGMLLQEIYGFADTDAVAPPGSPTAQPGDDSHQMPECIVCMADPKDTILLPCRHLCLCKECAQELRRQSTACPICRQPFHSMLHIAQPNKECEDPAAAAAKRDVIRSAVMDSN
ncbi:hypothetical protein BC828DRAFT_383918 [Blastocladiella britannica]|nr:hypothetical protein BC828DRAFT_383918 [Blastocladiella britannica]